MRLFFAVELPSDVQAALGRLRPGESGDYRWVEPAMLHVTLAFLGQQPAERLEALRDIGRAAASAAQPGLLRLGDAGSFGPRNAPRVLWVGLAGDVQRLLDLQADLSARLRAIGIPLEERSFSPHITLARRRDSAKPGTPLQPGSPERAAFRLHALTLFESRLSPRGATYTVLDEVPLGLVSPG
jgi:RNA 2',3'-cyclic 3'-phosphodiesterase